MNTLFLVSSAVFILGYIAIIFEHRFHLHKSATALIMGVILWLVGMLFGITNLNEHVLTAGAEIFELIIFLLSAMSLIEILIHYNFFDIVRTKILSLGLNDKAQFWIISIIAFFLSAVIDNLTTTIIMIQIARKFFKDKNLLIAAVSIVIAANAGGAWSPIGDVTTIMLWINNKFNALHIISVGLLPSLALFLIATWLLARKLTNSAYDSKTDILQKLTRSEKIIIGIVFASFSLPLIMNLVGLPPFLGLLLGLGITWATIDIFKQVSKTKTHLEVSLEKLIQKVDIASIQFFIGILLAVSALETFGVLHHLSNFIFGADPMQSRIIIGNIALGLISPILDNIPLTAIAIKIIHSSNQALWVLLAITVGTGGSLLNIGSAPGVIATGLIKKLNFNTYLKIGFIPALVGFITAVGVWYLEYMLF